MAFSAPSLASRLLSSCYRLSPAVKLLGWLVALLALTATSGAIASATGYDVSLLNKNGGTVVLTLAALVGLLTIVATENRPFAEYGLVADAAWMKRAALGIGTGVAFYACYLALCLGFGAVSIDTSSITWARSGKSLLAAVSSIPLATVQQIIFAGLLVGLLRPQMNRTLAVALPGLVFGVAVGLGCDGGLTSPEGQRLCLGMTVLASLLGALRLTTGSIVMPAGVLAGALMVRRVASKLRLLDFDTTAGSHWLAPSADPRQGTLFALLLGAATLAVMVVLHRRGETQLATDPAADAKFKRFMPFSNLLTFIPLDYWARLLIQPGGQVGLIYVPRLIVTLIGSAIGTIIALPERVLAPLLLRHKVDAPVFVVGIHRSGTTHLHNLLSLDKQFRAPRNYEVFNPLGFMTGWLTTLLMTPALMWRRPMDSVQMTPFTSQEEEFALAAMGVPSPYHAFCLPQQTARHWKYMHADSFNHRDYSRWSRAYRLFLRKLTCWSRRTPLLKNPANTGRMSLLKRMYPQAKFVYLVRRPEAVYRSNMHFAKQGLVVFQLQDPCEIDNYAANFLENYRQVSTAAERDLAELDSGHGIRVRFEDLETDPIGVVSEIYAALGLEMTFDFRHRLQQYVERNAGYRKNKPVVLPADEAAAVRRTMAPFYGMWGYDSGDERRQAA